MMELTDEMKEAIRILREDGQIASYNNLSDSQQKIIERLDAMDQKINKRDIEANIEEEKPNQPPPEIVEEEIVVETPKGRKRWNEHYGN